MSDSIDSATELDPPETVCVLNGSGEEVIERVRLVSVDPEDEVAYGVTHERGQRIRMGALGRLIDDGRLVPARACPS